MPERIRMIVTLLLALLLPLALPWLKTPLILGTAFGIAALGISILIISGQISFGHALFFGTGAYVQVMAQVHAGWNPWTTLALAMAMSAPVLPQLTRTLASPFFTNSMARTIEESFFLRKATSTGSSMATTSEAATT